MKLLAETVDDIPPEDWPEVLRAHGQIPCVVCGVALDRHYQPAKLTCPTIVRDCAGRWWKL